MILFLNLDNIFGYSYDRHFAQDAGHLHDKTFETEKELFEKGLERDHEFMIQHLEREGYKVTKL